MFFSLQYNNVDEKIKQIVDYIKRINDIMPELNATIQDTTQYNVVYGNPDSDALCYVSYTQLLQEKTFYLYKKTILPPSSLNISPFALFNCSTTEHIACPALDKINAICKEMLKETGCKENSNGFGYLF